MVRDPPVGARFGVRLISWSRWVLLGWNRSLLLAFSDILFSFISIVTWKSSALRVSGSDFLEASVSNFKTRVPQSLKVSNLPFYWPLNKNQWKSNITQDCGFDFYWFTISIDWFLLIFIDHYWCVLLLILIKWYRRVFSQGNPISHWLVSKWALRKLRLHNTKQDK